MDICTKKIPGFLSTAEDLFLLGCSVQARARDGERRCELARKESVLLVSQAAETKVNTTVKGNLGIMSSAFTLQTQFSAIHRTGSS